MKLPVAAVLVFALLPACLENEEQITVRPDGSCSVRVMVKGQAPDFADGYPLPCGPQWRIDRASVPDYIGWLRSGMTSEELRARLPEKKGSDGDLAFELSSDFASVQDLPKYFAPERDPYRTAYLSRAALLKIEKHGSKQLYTFELHLGARDYEHYDVWSWMKRKLPMELIDKLDRLTSEQSALTEHELEEVVRVGREAMLNCAMSRMLDAVTPVFTTGDASLPAALPQRLGERLQPKLTETITEARLRRIISLVSAPSFEREGARKVSGTDEEHLAGKELQSLEEDIRKVLRSSLKEALQAERVPTPTSNGILAQLEWGLTASDHTADLGDETFRFSVSLPGVIVGGNAHDYRDGAFVWEIKGNELQDREIVLRAVSVVE